MELRSESFQKTTRKFTSDDWEFSGVSVRNRSVIAFSGLLIFLAMGTSAHADEKVLYRYDVSGRMTKAYRQTGPASGALTKFAFDKAANRSTNAANNVVQTINAGQSIWSQDGRFQLAMQADGNLVLYQSTTVLWVAPGTHGTTNTAIFQTDGNFVVYGPSGALWSAAIQSPGGELFLQNDGNLVIYSIDGVAAWDTHTGGH